MSVLVNENTPLILGNPNPISNDEEKGEGRERSGSHASLSDHKGTIGMLGSIAIAVNSLTGPAMLNLPSVFQRSGVIPTILTITFLCVLSTWCSLHMANTISKVRGNAHFHHEIEYSEAFRYFVGPKAYIFTHICFFGCITCLNLASIVDTAQVIDQVLSRMKGGAVAFEWKQGGWEKIRWAAHNCSGEKVQNGKCIPFETGVYNDSQLLTMGYLICALIFLPMSLKDLKENSVFQIVGFIVLIVISLQFAFTFYMEGLNFSNVSWWGDDWGDMFGIILFNFAVVIAIPAWLYERKPEVCVHTAVTNSSIIGFVLYLLVGGLGALTMPDISDNMLASMMSGAYGTATEVFSMIFCLFIIGLGIPLFSVLTRLNLTGSGLCSEFVANIFAVYLPWGTAWLLYGGGGTTWLLGWGGIIFTSIIVFIAPLALSLYVVYTKDTQGSVPVYGSYVPSKVNQEIFLWILLAASIGSIILAIIGEFS